MKFAFYSVEGTSLSLVRRVMDEGHEVLLYVKPPEQRIGVGVVPRTNNYAEWVGWGRGGVYVFDCTGVGEQADILQRTGALVVGGGKLCDKLEDERGLGTDLARKAGLHIPQTWEFGSIPAAINFVKGQRDGGFYFKPNNIGGTSATCGADDPDSLVRKMEGLCREIGAGRSNIVQEKIKGVAVSTARWFNGKGWTGPTEHTIEHKAFMDGDKGPATGCSLNVVWYEAHSKLADALCYDALGEELAKLKATPGIYDINSIVSEEDGEAYFLEWTPRFGYDSETTGQRGVHDYGKLLYNLAAGYGADDLFEVGPFMASVRLSVPPYPYEEYSKLPDGKASLDLSVYGTDGLWSKYFIGYHLAYSEELGLHVASKSGLVGLALGTGKSIQEAVKLLYKWLESGKLEVKNLQYRTDAEKVLVEDMKKLVRSGY